jgi:hypothetical protein
MRNEIFYEEGRTQGANFIHKGEGKEKDLAEKIYNDFCKQPDFDEDGEYNESKSSFISGWVDAMFDSK